MQPKVLLGFKALSDVKLLIKAEFVHSSMSGHPHYDVSSWPPKVAPLSELATTIDLFRDAIHAAQTHDSNKIAERNRIRATLEDILQQLAAYVEFAAHGDVVIMASAGFDLRRDTTPVGGRNQILPAPSDFRVAHGQRSGTVDLHVAREVGAKSYHVQVTEGDPMVEANWRPALTSANGSRITLTGLTPGHTYWFRICCVSAPGYGLWTEPLSLMVV